MLTFIEDGVQIPVGRRVMREIAVLAPYRKVN
jgi:hypothetical protein